MEEYRKVERVWIRYQNKNLNNNGHLIVCLLYVRSFTYITTLFYPFNVFIPILQMKKLRVRVVK